MTNITSVGIDVGGPAKGFYAVALRDGTYLDQLQTKNPDELLHWALDHGALCIAIDAPCSWRIGANLRRAERELISNGIRCFPTPCRKQAVKHPTGWYDWMLEGEKLYLTLQHRYGLLNETRMKPRHRRCVETFPHAITQAFLGAGIQAKNKRYDRLAILENQGVEFPQTLQKKQDAIDAALCALTAHYLATRQRCRFFGEPITGYITIPSSLFEGVKR